MRCSPLVLDGKVVGIVCGARRKTKVEPCAFCSRPSARLCDYPVLPGRTCDRPLCPAHATSMGQERDLCPHHAPPRQRAADLVDTFAPVAPQPVPHGPGCPRCDAGLCHGCAACKGEVPHRIASRRWPGPWVGVVGARDHGNLAQLDHEVDALPPDATVVSGGARGVDGYGVARARSRGLRTVVLEADWTRGKTAGFQRNGEVVVVVDRFVAATWWGCRGTHDTIAKAEVVGVPVTLVKPRASQLEVWTSRLSPTPDPDTLDITLMSGRRQGQVLGDRWKAIAAAARSRELVKMLRELERREGMSLVELQRRARVEHAPSIGEVWAPTPKLLYPTLEALHALEGRAEGAALASAAAEDGDAAREAVLAEVRVEAARVWAGYAEAFLVELRGRFTRFPEAWGWLLGKRRVVLACACSRPSYHDPAVPWARCHRFLVAEALGKCGATPMGELQSVNPSPAQLGLSY